MIELPEAITIGRQVEQILAGRKVTNVYGATYLCLLYTSPSPRD